MYKILVVVLDTKFSISNTCGVHFVALNYLVARKGVRYDGKHINLVVYICAQTKCDRPPREKNTNLEMMKTEIIYRSNKYIVLLLHTCTSRYVTVNLFLFCLQTAYTNSSTSILIFFVAIEKLHHEYYDVHCSTSSAYAHEPI